MEFFTALPLDAANIFLYALVFLATISLVVFIHEMGHFLTARLFGVRVQKFSIGFGKELFGYTAKDGTRWCLSRIPLGGYVQIFGYGSAAEVLIWDAEKQERRPLRPEEKPYAFCEKPLWQRMLIVAMGPLINFIFAFAIFFCMFITIGEPSTRPYITAVNMNSSGYEAGFLPMDTIVSINGQNTRRMEDLWEKSGEAGVKLDLIAERDGKRFERSIVSRGVDYIDLKGIERAHGQIGLTNFNGVRFAHIVSVNGVPRPESDDALRSILIEILDQPARIGVKMGQGDETEFLIYPRSDVNENLLDPSDPAYSFFYLIQTAEPYYIHQGPMDAAWYAYKRLERYVGESVKFLSVILQGKGGQERIGGLVTMGSATRKAVEKGTVMYLIFLAVLSVQIGFINLFPVPALDGGYLLFFAIEGITGHALPERVQDYALTTGMILLFGMMIFANMNDILRLLS